MDTQTRPRPSVQPIFTEYHNLEGYPRSAFSVPYSPYSSSPSSPRTLPGVLHRPIPRAEPPLRSQRPIVDSLDTMSRRENSLTPNGSRLAQIAEGSPGSARAIWPAPPASFSQTRRSSGIHIPRHLSQVPRRPTIVDETRSLLTAGIPSEHLRTIGRAISHQERQDRRRSLPSTPLTTRRRNSHAIREQLLMWGHVYYGNAVTADCFVVGVALRRNSEATPNGNNKDQPSDGSSSAEKQANTDNNRVTIRARIRPRELERKPFILQRSLNLDEIRGTVPEPPPTPASAATTSGRRKSVEMLSPGASTPRTGDFQRRASSVSDQGRDGKEGGGESISRHLIRGANALPMHITYARIHLPVLAALMLSGHIRKGDIVDLPMPHPEVWPQTVAYIYTGQAELTASMKQNILYLGGKVG